MNGFSNPLRPFEVRLLSALLEAARSVDPLNRLLCHCVIGKIQLKRDLSSTFHHPV